MYHSDYLWSARVSKTHLIDETSRGRITFRRAGLHPQQGLKQPVF